MCDRLRRGKETGTLVEENRKNPHYRFWYSDALTTARRPETAVEAAQKAVDLNPDGLYRGRLAAALEAVGRLDEAEEIYNDMLRDHPDRPKYWFWYAKFLVEHHPERVEDLREALSNAEKPDADWGTPPDELLDLRKRTGLLAPRPASRF